MSYTVFEWDEAKNRRNICKHGISFPTATALFDLPHFVRWDGREVYSEDHWLHWAFNMKKKSDTDWKRLATMPDKDIDFSDIPELDEAFFKEARWRPPVKQSVTIRLDADVLEWFRSQGPGYQTRINRLLRRYMEVNTHPD